MVSFMAAHGPIIGTARMSTPPGTAVSASPGWNSVGCPSERSTKPDVAERRDVAVDHRVLPADGGDQQVTDHHLLARGQRIGSHLGELARLLGQHDRRLDVHLRVRVGPHQPRQVLGIGVVGVGVGDQDRVEVGEPVPVVGEVARVDQHPRVVGLDEHG